MNEEQLLEFLYIAPVALIQFDENGAVKLANPRVAQLFNRYAPGGYFANFYDFLGDILPELKSEIVNYESTSGQIMENDRFCINAPTETGNEELWLDVTVMRQDEGTYIASLNNVTNQVKAELDKYLTEQKLTSVFDTVSKHVIFTLSSDGIIDSWNSTGETYITSEKAAKGKLLSQLLDISVPDNARYLSEAKNSGFIKDRIEVKTKSESKLPAQLCISSIKNKQGNHCGYSVVITLGDESHLH